MVEGEFYTRFDPHIAVVFDVKSSPAYNTSTCLEQRSGKP